MSRRRFIIAGAVLFAGGCQQASQSTGVPGVAWPASGGRPTPGGEGYVPDQPARAPASASREPDPPRRSPEGGAGTPSNPFSRSHWATAGPANGNINPMNGVRRITLHHEGMPDAIHFSDASSTRDRLEMIRRSHRNRGWADIGYHYIIDRAGRVWEGRPVRYQGAHVGRNNEHNLGVMCLGNFDIQHPSEAQVVALRETVRVMRRRFNVPQDAIFTHQELRASACPGRHMQPRIAAMRRAGQFA